MNDQSSERLDMHGTESWGTWHPIEEGFGSVEWPQVVRIYSEPLGWLPGTVGRMEMAEGEYCAFVAGPHLGGLYQIRDLQVLHPRAGAGGE